MIWDYVHGYTMHSIMSLVGQNAMNNIRGRGCGSECLFAWYPSGQILALPWTSSSVRAAYSPSSPDNPVRQCLQRLPCLTRREHSKHLPRLVRVRLREITCTGDARRSMDQRQGLFKYVGTSLRGIKQAVDAKGSPVRHPHHV